jgi:hypothetical protein
VSPLSFSSRRSPHPSGKQSQWAYKTEDQPDQVRPRRCSYPHCGGGRRRGPAGSGASLRRQTPARSSRTRCILDAAAIDIAEKDAGEEQQGEVRPARCSYRHCRGGRRRDGDQWGDHTHNAAYPVSIGFDAPPPVTASPSCSSPPPRSSYSKGKAHRPPPKISAYNSGAPSNSVLR